jgi:hypothetical protein
MIGKFSKSLLTSFFLVVACETGLIEGSFAADPSPQAVATAPAPASAAYEHVASQLDPNGSIYIYWNTERLLGEMDHRLESIKNRALGDANLTASQLIQFQSGFDLVRHLLQNSGLEAVKAFGMSYTRDDSGLYVGKAVLYVPNRSGYLWGSIAKPSHDFTFLKLIPVHTEAFYFFDFDLATFWGGVSKDLAASGIPEITTALQQLPAQTEAVAGMSLDDLLGSLGDQIGLIVTLDPEKTVKIPFGTSEAVIPEPAVALLLKLQNDKIFDRVDAIFSANPGVEKTDEPDLKLRVIRGNGPIAYVIPTLARYGDYMILSSSDALVRGIVDANTGKSQGIKTSAEFNALSAGMPDNGNSAVYVSQRFQTTVAALQIRYNEAQPSVDLRTRKLVESFAALSSEIASYKVTGAKDDSLITTAKMTKDPNDLLGELIAIPVEALVQDAIADLKRGEPTNNLQPQPPAEPQATPLQSPEDNNGAESAPVQPDSAAGKPPPMIQKTRPSLSPRARLAQIRVNLALLSAAKDQVALQKSLKEGDSVSREDLQHFLPMWPQPVAGEVYEVGFVGQSPYATAPVAVGRIAAGSKIQP